MLRHILIKLTKIKDIEYVKSSKGKATNDIQGNPIWLSADFSAETLQTRKEWHSIFKVIKRKNLQPRILYAARLSFRLDREIKSFQFSSVQSLSCVWLFVTPWMTACQASLSITNSRSLLKLMSIELVMLSSHLILCHPRLLLPPVPPSFPILPIGKSESFPMSQLFA